MRREATPGLFYLRSLPRVQDHRAATLPGVQDVPTAASSSVSPAPAAPTSAAVTVSAVTDVTFLMTGWQKLQSSPELCAPVTVQTIIQYFLDSVAADDMPTHNFKALEGTDSKSCRIFKCGFVQKIEVARLDNHVFFRARCEPEMRTGTPYKLRLAVDVVEKENKPVAIIRFTECLPCPAGKAPLACCKHIAALLYALEEVAKFGRTLPLETCTNVLQTWNQPQKEIRASSCA